MPFATRAGLVVVAVPAQARGATHTTIAIRKRETSSVEEGSAAGPAGGVARRGGTG
uniref:hypothetical protein n=1 Tax=Dietzia sp. oral taxon 368 TaxID=712270 RepID=UPI0013E9A907|nr:hypothetical protein [Dietzia sp. oral taxon 368]